jgi:enterobactin synthetase component F
LPRNFEAITAILAIIRAGAAFVPLDPENQPKNWRNRIISDTGASVIICSNGMDSSDFFEGISIIHVGKKHGVAEGEAFDVVESYPSDLAYVLYTSGTTGRPKGVSIQHDSLMNHLIWRRGYLKVSPDDVFFQATPLTFDESIWEMFLPLISGARLEILEAETSMGAWALFERLRVTGVTIIQFVPSVLTDLLNVLDEADCNWSDSSFWGSVDRVVLSGEGVFEGLAHRLKQLSGPKNFFQLWPY